MAFYHTVKSRKDAVEKRVADIWHDIHQRIQQARREFRDRFLLEMEQKERLQSPFRPVLNASNVEVTSDIIFFLDLRLFINSQYQPGDAVANQNMSCHTTLCGLVAQIIYIVLPQQRFYPLSIPRVFMDLCICIHLNMHAHILFLGLLF